MHGGYRHFCMSFWGTHIEIVQFLITSYQSIFPNYQIKRVKLVIALALASAPFTVIKNLLDIQHDFPPHQSLDWNQVIREMAVIDVSTRYQSVPLRATHKTFYFLAK